MDTIYDVVKINKVWHVCRLTPAAAERWELTSEGYKTRAQAFTEMHSQRFADRDARQLTGRDCHEGGIYGETIY